ncbi:MAG: alkaline phosphatase family protein [Bifidobacteriaceae bacterium]|jgi:hypothetical protein|nr:alkaline phosphatase family protein [Bifidobacteriaceae bacterium]
MTSERPAPPPPAPAAPEWALAPKYGPGSLAAVVPDAIAALGIRLDGPAGAPEAPGAAGAAPRGIVLVLADGLGWANLEARRGHAPFLWEAPRERRLTGFPSTTVASLGSFGTGLSPGQTALAGYSLRDPATGRRAVLIKWDTPTAPRVWQPEATLFERLAAAGHPAAFIGEARFENSSMTLSSLRGARFRPDGNTAQGRVAAALAAARKGEGLVYLYWGELDKVGHAKGWQSPDWAAALERLDRSMADLAARLPAGWELWLTADHGMIDIGGGAPVWDVRDHPALAEGVDLIAGEARAVHVYTRQPEAVAQRWRGLLGPGAWVLTKAEAVAAGLFGPVAERVLPYLGDVVAAMAGRGIVLDTPGQGPGPAEMVGHHGSLTAPEMAVPLLRWPARAA